MNYELLIPTPGDMKNLKSKECLFPLTMSYWQTTAENTITGQR